MKNLKQMSLILLLPLIWLGCSHFNPTENVNSTNPERVVSSEEIPFADLEVPFAYDPGPSPRTAMGKELIDLVARQPHMPGISEELTRDQKFRPAFGPTLWRMIQQPNSVKILFIGQDGTHIAEAAGRTATAGFGGRAQDLAAYFGVRTGAAFMNTFAYTIRGQYGAFNAPFISEENGQPKANMTTVVENGIWLMAQDQNSPMVKWRNDLIDWIIRNNKDSLKMIVLFGGSAQDSIGTFIESKGGKVGARFTEQDIRERKIRVPRIRTESAGSNKEFPTVLNVQGKDIYPELVGRRLDYSKEEDQQAATKALQEKISSAITKIAFAKTGVGGSGVVHPAQIGGYDLRKIEVNGTRTLSLRGLPLSDGSKITQDLLVTEFPHPTSLSTMPPPVASQRIAASLKSIEKYVKAGWKIDADPGMTNEFAKGEAYRYGRSDIGPAYYDFGTPKNRMVSVSSASRMSGRPNIIVIGTREKAMFDNAKLTAASKAQPAPGISNQELFTARPRTAEVRYVFDRGPGVEMAKIMKENLDMKLISTPKKGMNPKTVFMDAYNIKSDPEDVADFGHFRGTFVNPKVVILADPDGYDDILTSRALTGTRGQYLHGLMEDLKVGDQYLIIKTVPFGMDGASDSEWATLLSQTANYRSKIFEAIFKNGTPMLVVSDGRFAAAEIDRLAAASKVPIVKIDRQGSDNDSGIKAAGQQISATRVFGPVTASGRMANLPRSHLGFFARVWEGTSGTRVFAATTKADSGIAYAIVAPEWSFRQRNVIQNPDEKKSLDTLKQTFGAVEQ